MYIAYKDFSGKIVKGNIVLMSAAEWEAGGKNLTGVPVTITQDGKEPVDAVEISQPEISPPESEPEPDRIALLEARLAKIEAVPLVKTALEPIAIVRN